MALNILDFLVYPVFMIISAPLIMKIFGDIGYGFWVIILALLSLANLFNLGISNASLQYVNNQKLNQDLVNKFVWFLIAISACFTFFIVGIATYLNQDIVIDKSFGVDKFTIVLIIFCLILEQYDYQNGANLKAFNRIRTNSSIDILAKLFMYTIGLYIVYKSSNMSSFVYIVFLTFVIKIIAKKIFLKRFSHSVSYGDDLVNKKEYLLTAMGFFFMAFNGFALIIGERFFLSNMYPLDDIGKIALGSQIIFFVHSVPAAAMSFLLPILSGQKHKLNKQNMMLLNALLSLFMLILVMLFIKLGGLELWLGKDDLIIKQVIYGLFIPVFLYSLCIAPYYYTMSQKRGFILSILMLIVSIMFLLSVYILRNTFTDIDSFIRIKYIYIIALSGVIYGLFLYQEVKQKKYISPS